MEAVYYAVRANLRRLLNLHPQYAQAVGMSVGWVKKWKQRLQEAEPEDEQVQGERLPRSSRTIYRILQQAGRIAYRLPHMQEPQERPAPMSHWQLDAERCLDRDP